MEEMIRIAARESSTFCHDSEEAGARGAAGAPDPEAVLRAIIDRRSEEAREMGEALARSVLVDVLGSREVRLALAVLRGGSDANHRLVDLCEARLVANGALRKEEDEQRDVSARRCGSRG